LLMFSMFFFNLSVVYFIASQIAQFCFGIEEFHKITEDAVYSAKEIYALLFVQGFSALGGFALTAMMFSVLETGEFKHHLRLKIYPSLKLILLAAVSIIVAQFFIEFLVTINKQIQLPSSLSFLTELREKEEAISNAMLNFTSVGHFVFAVLVMAVIPAVSEEFFFRGLLLGDLLREKVHPAFAIAVTGFIFAISHAQFENTLAIWALGSFLGYLYYVSGSLWLPILVHFINNFLALLLKYLFNLGVISSDLAEAETPLYATVISILIFSGFVFLFNKWKNPATFVEEDEFLNENPNT
jgi:membrane protease YdiL (CAAX protease family)